MVSLGKRAGGMNGKQPAVKPLQSGRLFYLALSETPTYRAPTNGPKKTDIKNALKNPHCRMVPTMDMPMDWVIQRKKNASVMK